MKSPSRRCMRDLFLASAALAASAATFSRANNLLGNPGFETPDASAGDVQANPNGGGNIGSGGQGDWVAVAGNTYYTQTHALSGMQSGKMFGNVGLFQQTVAVAHDTDTFTAQVMMLNASNDALTGGEGGFINMDFFDINGNRLTTITGSEEGFSLKSTSPQDVWTLEKVTAPGVPGTAYVQVDLVAGPFTGIAGASGGAVFVDDADFEEVGQVLATWLSPTNGSWGNSANWTNSVIPQHATESAIFGNVNTASPTTVSLDGNWTVGSITFNSTNSYSIVPGTGGALTLDNGASPASLTVSNGRHSISANLTLNSPTVVTVTNSGDSLTLSGSVTGASLTKAGGGTLNISRLRLPGVTVSAGTLKVSPNGTNSSASVVSSLSIAPGATLDLSDNDMIVNYSAGSSPASVIRGYLASAYNGGAWNGSGLASSSANSDAAHRTALGYGEATDLGFAQFDGQSIPGSAVIVKYTYYGDSTLDGKVDLGNDFNLFLTGFITGGSTWTFGDYNYDGQVNMDDFVLFLDAFKSQGGPLGDLEAFVSASPDLTTVQKANLFSAIPEPTIIGVMALAPMLGMRRRR